MKRIYKIVFCCTLLNIAVLHRLSAQDIFADGGAASAQYKSITFPPAAEDYTRAFDNNPATKYLLFNWPGSAWLQWEATAAATAVEYTITSGNDAPQRDPKDWELLGSQDGINWTLLDTRTNESFATRGLTQTYTLANTVAYKFYRLRITAILNTPASTLFQMADWALKAAGGVDIFPLGGTSSAQYQRNFPFSNATEDWTKSFDGLANTKYLLQSWPGSAWLHWNCATPAITAQYTITSANDDATRDPRNWQLLGSQDSLNWTILDTKTGEVFASRGLVRTFSIPNTTAYKHYRLLITANNGNATLMQVADWRLLKGLPPAAPGSLSLAVMSPTQIFVKWADNSSNETSFELERSRDGINFTPAAQVSTNVTEYINTGLTHNTRYYYRVRSVNQYGASAYSAVVNAITLNYGSDTRDLTDEPGTYSVQYANASPGTEDSSKLIDNDINTKYLIFAQTWDPDGPPTPDYWVQYRVNAPRIVTYYTITSANDAPDRDPKNWELLGSNDGTNWTVIDTRSNEFFPGRFQTRIFIVTNNTTAFTYYRWHITANNGGVNIAGQIAEWEVFGVDPTVPIPPSNLRPTGVTNTTVSLAWTDNSTNETGFEIARSEDSLNFVTVGTVNANVTTYTDQAALPGFDYYYQVRARGASDNSFWSNIADTTTTIDPNLPRSPRNLRVISVTNTSASLTWDDMSTNETGFEIERSSDGNNFTQVGTTGVNENTFTNTGLTLATRYFYRVRAVNSFGNSYYSNVRQVITSGQNQAPAFNSISNQTTCNIHDTLTVNITGITPGPETWQQVTLGVVSSNNSLFSVLSISPVVNGNANLRYKAKPGTSGGTATITLVARDNGGVYNGGTDSLVQTFTITITPLNIQIIADRPIPAERFATIQLTASGAANYQWENAHGIAGGQTSSTLTVKPTMNTTYKVTGSATGGCRNEAELLVTLAGDYNPEVVNVLTPNGDGKNDYFVIWNIATYTNNEVKVYDRAGRLVFYKKNYTNDWDGTYNGKPLPEGSYIYIIDFGRGIPNKKGVLTIIRK